MGIPIATSRIPSQIKDQATAAIHGNACGHSGIRLYKGKRIMRPKRMYLMLCAGATFGITGLFYGVWLWNKDAIHPSAPQPENSRQQPTKTEAKLQAVDGLAIPLVASNEMLLSYGASSLVRGDYKSLKRCEREHTEGMMKRAGIINTLYKEVCSQERLDQALKQASGQNSLYTTTINVNSNIWEYYTRTCPPKVVGPIDWVEEIALAWGGKSPLPEGITQVSFTAHKSQRPAAHRDVYSAEIYGEGIGRMEVERAFFNEEGEMIAYLRFRRDSDQYILLLNKMEIQEKLCMTF